jgi:hypothetical protein
MLIHELLRVDTSVMFNSILVDTLAVDRVRTPLGSVPERS